MQVSVTRQKGQDKASHQWIQTPVYLSPISQVWVIQISIIRQKEQDKASYLQRVRKGHARPGSRERWSFSPPRNWTERPSRPLTRSVAAWRERDRGYTDKGAEQWLKRGQLDYNEKKNTLTCDLCIFDYC